MTDVYDLVVIGGGPAGEKAAAKAAYWGKKVCVIEAQAEPGGAAVHTGTLPSKTLRETAIYLSGYQNKRMYGLTVSLDPGTTVPRMIERKNAIAQMESRRIRENLERHGIDLVHGRASFIDTTRVAVQSGDRRWEIGGEIFLIATGSKPRRPAELPMDDPDVHDSDSILMLDRLPEDLVIIGGGVIGCEYACMFAALGVAVTVVDPRSALLPFMDAELVARLLEVMTELGVRFQLGSGYRTIERAGNIRTVLDNGEVLQSEKLLFAAGRTGNTANLGLENVGIEANRRGQIPVDDTYRTATANIYAVGDVIGFPALASVSMDQGRNAVSHAFDLPNKVRVGRLLPYGIYTIPELSCAGITEETCKEKGIPYVVGRAEFSQNARGHITGDFRGMTKLIVHAEDGHLLGVHMVGERATELIHLGQLAVLNKLPVVTFVDMVFNYPTLSETYKYAAYDALGSSEKTKGQMNSRHKNIASGEV